MKKLMVLVSLCCLCGMFVHAQELEKGVRNAVNKLAEYLQIRWDVSIEPMTMEGTDKKYPFSRQLYSLVLECATNNPRYFRVVDSSQTRGSGPRRIFDQNKGLIKGNFAIRGDKVEVFLNLVSDPDGVSLGAHRFNFPLAELPANAFELGNEEKSNSSDQVFKELADTGNTSTMLVSANPVSANQTINILAEFNSPSMTYLHRDELKMTVMADQDCFFKVYHIDVNNQMKMIYPNSSDKNNVLKANIPREIFESLAWRIYKPYGAETILVVASSQQFDKIDQEYNAPWKPATAETIRTAVRDNSGGEHETRTSITFSGECEAKYSITILKPDEEYSYGKPENMEEFYQSMRKDIERQGGTFEDGDIYSGSYTINGVRGSYRVPNDAPDTVEFAMYNNYTGNRSRGQTRGSGFNFSFERPANITQTIQTVRSSIEGCGGRFLGNEREGNFNAKGIAGQYRISHLVDITITEKPLVVPNSLIEKEVRNYFGRR